MNASRAKALTTPVWLASLGAVIALGLAARLLFLGDKALWLDEAYSVWFSAQDWSYLWHEVPQFETHPPLYYSLLKLWRGFGSDEVALRLLSVLAGVATIALVALTAGIATPQKHRLPVAVTAALLFASMPLQIDLAQQARPYALLMLGLGIVLACASWIVTHPHEAARPLWRGRLGSTWAPAAFLGLGFGSAMVLWLHNLGAIFVAVIGAFLAAWWCIQRGRSGLLFVNFLIAALLALLLYAPNIPTLMLQVQAVSDKFWLQAPSPADLCLLLISIYGRWQHFLQRPFDQLALQALVALPLAVLGIKGMFRLSHGSSALRWNTWLLLATAIGPAAIMLALTYTAQPVLLSRTLAPVQISWAVLCAATPFAVNGVWRRLVWGIIVSLAVLSMAGDVAYDATEARRDAQRPWRAIAESIIASDAAAAPVVVLHNSAALPLAYYGDALGADLAIHPLPAPYPARGSAYRYPSGGRGVPAIDETSLPALQALTAGRPSVWLIVRWEQLFDPTQMVRSDLAERFPCAETQSYGIVAVTRFDRPGAGEACP